MLFARVIKLWEWIISSHNLLAQFTSLVTPACELIPRENDLLSHANDLGLLTRGNDLIIRVHKLISRAKTSL